MQAGVVIGHTTTQDSPFLPQQQSVLTAPVQRDG